MRVRVLDYKTGKALPHRQVCLLVPHADGQVYSDTSCHYEKTDGHGVVIFQLQSPNPERVWITADFPCTRRQEFAVTDVLQRGAVGDHANFELCKNPTSTPVTATPGEVVIYIRRLNPWLRFERLVVETFEF